MRSTYDLLYMYFVKGIQTRLGLYAVRDIGCKKVSAANDLKVTNVLAMAQYYITPQINVQRWLHPVPFLLRDAMLARYICYGPVSMSVCPSARHNSVFY